MTRWVRVEATTLRTTPAGRRQPAATAALDGPDPKLLVVYGPADGDPPGDIADAIGDVAGGVPGHRMQRPPAHIGSGHRADTGGGGVGLGGDIDVATAAGTDFNQRPRQVGEEVGVGADATARPGP